MASAGDKANPEDGGLLLRESDARAAPSPNFGPRPDGLRPDLVVIHYTGMRSAEAALERLCDPEAKVSAHYLIDLDGTLYALVPEEARAWHAGVSSWRGERDVNSASIGIELVNQGHLPPGDTGVERYHPFPEPQMARLEALLSSLTARWDIDACGVVGHSDIAPERKSDPGERFDWARLQHRGLALGPAAAGAPVDMSDGVPSERFAAAAARIGYGEWRPESVLTAFRRRFAPHRVGEALGPEDARCAESVALECAL